MVYYFKSRCGEYTMYMGKDKYENEDLIAYGLPEDCWFHVDDLSSAHVYLRLKPGQTLDDIPPEALLDCSALVKANSIVGCKQSSVYVVYTRWKNLKKTSDMVDGQVGFHRPENVRRIQVEKNNTVVNALNKTKVELHPDLRAEQHKHMEQTQREKKENRKQLEKERRKAEEEKRRMKEELSYDRVMTQDRMMSNSEMKATADNTAAEEFEEDFF